MYEAVKIKCFETEHMPVNVYEYIEDMLRCGDDGDTVVMWIVDDDNDPPSPEIQWFLDHGAEYHEKVIVHRGTW